MVAATRRHEDAVKAAARAADEALVLEGDRGEAAETAARLLDELR
jgi:hypothetical protein